MISKNLYMALEQACKSLDPFIECGFLFMFPKTSPIGLQCSQPRQQQNINRKCHSCNRTLSLQVCTWEVKTKGIIWQPSLRAGASWTRWRPPTGGWSSSMDRRPALPRSSLAGWPRRARDTAARQGFQMADRRYSTEMRQQSCHRLCQGKSVLSELHYTSGWKSRPMQPTDVSLNITQGHIMKAKECDCWQCWAIAFFNTHDMAWCDGPQDLRQLLESHFSAWRSEILESFNLEQAFLTGWSVF